jgi:hypothetical protein
MTVVEQNNNCCQMESPSSLSSSFSSFCKGGEIMSRAEERGYSLN